MVKLKTKKTALQAVFLFGGEGEIWTLAPVARPTPLAGAPLHHLSTSPCVKGCCQWTILTSANCKDVILQSRTLFFYEWKHIGRFLKKSGGEGGIRTHAPFRTNGFQDRLVMTASIPLRMWRFYFAQRMISYHIPRVLSSVFVKNPEVLHHLFFDIQNLLNLWRFCAILKKTLFRGALWLLRSKETVFIRTANR